MSAAVFSPSADVPPPSSADDARTGSGDFHFQSPDGVALFYKAWLPADHPETALRRAIILLHRGHE